jgi:predicted anti-sigma-YlaC factor YlaD
MTLSLGVYVLGAVEPAERARISEHLACCEACRDEFVRLAALPGLLQRVPAAEVAHLAGRDGAGGTDGGG